VKITLVSRSFQDLINREVDEWKKADNNPKAIPESPKPIPDTE
jgi:hypothetical protein